MSQQIYTSLFVSYKGHFYASYVKDFVMTTSDLSTTQFNHLYFSHPHLWNIWQPVSPQSDIWWVDPWILSHRDSRTWAGACRPSRWDVPRDTGKWGAGRSPGTRGTPARTLSQTSRTQVGSSPPPSLPSRRCRWSSLDQGRKSLSLEYPFSPDACSLPEWVKLLFIIHIHFPHYSYISIYKLHSIY